MPRSTELDRQWQDLMSMCAKESDYKASQRHPKLLRFITEQINQLAAQMGFSARQIKTREFRSEKDGERVIRIIIE
jgi:4'-phosphopantetheinyl transferase EntD